MRKSLLYILLALVAGACTPEEQDNPFIGPTCHDGIRNQDEEEIDCGGRCAECVVKVPPLESPCVNSLADNVVTINGTNVIIAQSDYECGYNYQGQYQLYIIHGNKEILVALSGSVPDSDRKYDLTSISYPESGEASFQYYENKEGPYGTEQGTLYVFVKNGKISMEFCDLKLTNPWTNTPTSRTVSGRVSCSYQ